MNSDRPRTIHEAASRLISEVARKHGVPVETIFSKASAFNRGIHGAARQEAMRCVRRLGFSYPQVGRIFGRDHTTVMHACRKAGS